MTTKPKPEKKPRKPTKKERAELARLVREYQPMPRPLSKEERARAYKEILDLFD